MKPPLEASQPKLKRSIGLWMATALVIGNMVGSGIFTLPALLAGEAGPASIVSLALTGLGAILFGMPIYVWLKWRQANGKEEHLYVPDEFATPEPPVPTLQ